MLQRLPVGRRAIFCINKVDIRLPRNKKKCENFKILLESCQVTSKLSADSFMSRQDRMVPQKIDFKKKIFEKVANSCNPPLVSELRDIGLCKILYRIINFSSPYTQFFRWGLRPQTPVILFCLTFFTILAAKWYFCTLCRIYDIENTVNIEVRQSHTILIVHKVLQHIKRGFGGEAPEKFFQVLINPPPY